MTDEIVVRAPERWASHHALAIIKHFEQLRLRAYLPTPEDVPTIGWGHTKGVVLGDRCTEAEAEAFLDEDLKWAEAAVRRFTGNTPTTRNQFDALVSLCFNIGETNFYESSLLRHHKQGHYKEAEAQFHRWRFQKGRPLRGLIRRRWVEADLYGTPDDIPWELAQAEHRFHKANQGD